jgi:hypothetical protein
MLFRHSTGSRFRIRTLALLVIANPVLVLITERPATAVPPGITFSRITPVDGTTLLVSRTAANNPLDPPTFQLKADLFLNNSSGTDREVTNIKFSYPGSSIASRTYNPKAFVDDDDDPDTPNIAQNFVMAAAMEGRVPIHDGLDRDLPTPLPATVKIEVFLDADAVPLVLNFGLAFRENAVPPGAHFFPAKADDLDPGEYWFFGTRHVVDSGGGIGGVINPSTGSQRYAIDMGVAAWDTNINAWNDKHELTDGTLNEHFRIWEKALYATHDGIIVQCFRGEPDEDPAPFEDITFDFGFGNSLFIQSGGDLVSYGHMRNGTIPFDLCPPNNPPDQPTTGLSIPVTAGQFLGRVGNTGRSTAPHLHIQVEHIPSTGPDTVSGAPMQFLNIRALADDVSLNNLGQNPTLRPLHGMTLHRNSLILPNPCGFDLPPEGLLEVSRHGISGECYQDAFNLIVARGYRPVFADGYDVGGQTFFNATFRPAGPASVARHGLTGTEYQSLFDELTEDGFRLHQVDSYLDGGQVRYAAIFEIRSGPNFAAFHGLDAGDYAGAVDDLKNDGYVPVNVSTVEAGGQLFWTALFEQVAATGWTIQSVPVADYQATFDANVAAGRIPIYVHGFTEMTGPHLTGIWVDPVGGSTAAVHGLSSDDYQDAFELNIAAGRFTRYTTGYDDGAGDARFAAVWRGRPNTLLNQTPPLITNQTSATFGFAADNPFTTFQCRLDLAPFGACSSPTMLTSLSEGFHTYSVRAVDRELILDLSPASHTWLVDVTPPEIDIVAPIVNTKTVNGELKDDPVEITTVIGWADVVADVTDNLSGVATVQFKVDGVPVAGVMVDVDTWKFEFEPDQMGEHIYLVEVVATDNAANSSTASIQILGVATAKPH